MSKSSIAGDWREARRRSAQDAIVDAAWEVVRSDGLAGLSLRELAKRAGITTPTVYAYFPSKNAIYDAMFGQAAIQFADLMSEPYASEEPPAILAGGVRRFLEFCTSDSARYQLLFQRTIPGFEPSAASFAPAVRALGLVRERLALNGVRDPRHVDMWTALTTGLVDQQISNDPGGDRWAGLINDFVAMFLAYCRADVRGAPSAPASPAASRARS
jgi:AcrR family transcriptional regulator